MTFCDSSLIRGFNGAMVFSSSDGSLRTEFINDLYPDAPTQFKTKDTKGNNIRHPTQPYTGGTHYDLVNYYRGKFSIGNAYILPDDHLSSHGTTDKRIFVDIY
ncbi:unnamed protein product [Adineta steineri]|uniref:Uncharacterized protein n=1 Tax=Adineta steineri TaxID=433720 RepID=A0A813VQ41_9BILA|nr:unnamed protein product [Adineta steineri]CAF1171755.1 unnamed protein product [Adineta steineri]CAF1173078.1 unnamed protein product [Adineta steineri]